MGVKLQRVENTFIMIMMCRQRPIKQRLLLQYVEDSILFNNTMKPHIFHCVLSSTQRLLPIFNLEFLSKLGDFGILLKDYANIFLICYQ